MMITKERRQGAPRVQFERPLDARVMAIDGTWCRECRLIDVSETGAQIELASSAAELNTILSAANDVWRSCIPPVRKTMDRGHADESNSIPARWRKNL
jgi:hypothetical protein